jgi:single-stranded DNA-binding protein
MNTVVLIGNLTDKPYFDIIPGSNAPFTRLFLGVSLPRDLAQVMLKGNLTHEPYFARVGSDSTPFLRFHIAVNRRVRPGFDQHPTADFLRVVAYDDRAVLDHRYLQPGSEVLVMGNLRARKFTAGGRKQTCIEVVADPTEGITFLRKIDWAAGDAARESLAPDVLCQDQKSYLYGGGFFRVVAYGELAKLIYDHTDVGSWLFVRGRLRSRKRDMKGGKRETVIEIVAHNVKFAPDSDEGGDIE